MVHTLPCILTHSTTLLCPVRLCVFVFGALLALNSLLSPCWLVGLAALSTSFLRSPQQQPSALLVPIIRLRGVHTLARQTSSDDGHDHQSRASRGTHPLPPTTTRLLHNITITHIRLSK